MLKRFLIIAGVFFFLFSLRVYLLGGIEGSDFSFEKREQITEYGAPIRQYFASFCSQLLDEPYSALLAGMVLGEKSDLPSDFKKSLVNTSTIHIVVVSGQNLTLLAGFLLSFSPFFGRKKTVIASILLIVFYSVITGLQVPVLRAGVMFILTALGGVFNKEVRSWWILMLTAGVMLLFNPEWLASISFQLSFAATFAVLVAAPYIAERIRFLPEIIKNDLVVSLMAQLFTLPIIAYYFHRLSVSGIVVNSLVLWTVPLIMILGIVALIVAWLSIPLGVVLIAFPQALLEYFVFIVETFNSFSGTIFVGKMSVFFWIGYYLLLLGLIFMLKENPQKREAKIYHLN